MRYLTPVLAACSGLVVTVVGVNASMQDAMAAQVGTDASVVALGTQPQNTSTPKVREVCSRNRPLQVSADKTQLVSAQVPQELSLASNIVQMFCRDVRINTIVVRDYCAVIRE